MDPPLGGIDEGCDHEPDQQRQPILIDLDDNIEGFGDFPDFHSVMNYFTRARIIPMFESHKRDWRRFNSTKRMDANGTMLIFVKPPSTLHSVATLEELGDYCAGQRDWPSEKKDGGNETDADEKEEVIGT